MMTKRRLTDLPGWCTVLGDLLHVCHGHDAEGRLCDRRMTDTEVVKDRRVCDHCYPGSALEAFKIMLPGTVFRAAADGRLYVKARTKTGRDRLINTEGWTIHEPGEVFDAGARAADPACGLTPERYVPAGQPPTNGG